MRCARQRQPYSLCQEICPTEIIVPPSAELLAADTTVFSEFLSTFGLPSDNVIATDDERRVIAQNLPNFLHSLSPDEKQDARYLSKFCRSLGDRTL